MSMAMCKARAGNRLFILEQLEQRRLLSAAVDPAGILQIQGTAINDTILVQNDPVNSSLVDVTINGAIARISLAGIRGIMIGGFAGDDFITVRNISLPNVIVHGGAGNDTLVAGAAAAGVQLFAGSGDDVLLGQSAGDFDGAGGNDTLTAGAPGVLAFGDDGNDVLVSNNESALLFGGPAADTFYGGVGIGDIAAEDVMRLSPNQAIQIWAPNETDPSTMADANFTGSGGYSATVPAIAARPYFGGVLYTFLTPAFFNIASGQFSSGHATVTLHPADASSAPFSPTIRIAAPAPVTGVPGQIALAFFNQTIQQMISARAALNATVDPSSALANESYSMIAGEFDPQIQLLRAEAKILTAYLTGVGPAPAVAIPGDNGNAISVTLRAGDLANIDSLLQPLIGQQTTPAAILQHAQLVLQTISESQSIATDYWPLAAQALAGEQSAGGLLYAARAAMMSADAVYVNLAQAQGTVDFSVGRHYLVKKTAAYLQDQIRAIYSAAFLAAARFDASIAAIDAFGALLAGTTPAAQRLAVAIAAASMGAALPRYQIYPGAQTIQPESRTHGKHNDGYYYAPVCIDPAFGFCLIPIVAADDGSDTGDEPGDTGSETGPIDTSSDPPTTQSSEGGATDDGSSSDSGGDESGGSAESGGEDSSSGDDSGGGEESGSEGSSSGEDSGGEDSGNTDDESF